MAVVTGISVPELLTVRLIALLTGSSLTNSDPTPTPSLGLWAGLMTTLEAKSTGKYSRPCFSRVIGSGSHTSTQKTVRGSASRPEYCCAKKAAVAASAAIAAAIRGCSIACDSRPLPRLPLCPCHHVLQARSTQRACMRPPLTCPGSSPPSRSRWRSGHPQHL